MGPDYILMAWMMYWLGWGVGTGLSMCIMVIWFFDLRKTEIKNENQ